MSLKNSFLSLESKYKGFLSQTCKSPSTIQYRIGAAMRFVSYLEDSGILTFQQISPKEVFDYIHLLKEKRFKPMTLWNNARCIRGLISFLIYEKFVDTRDFPKSIEFFKKPHPERILSSPDDSSIEALLSILQNNLNSYLNCKSYLIARLLLLTKLTIKEIIDLKNIDVDLRKNTISCNGDLIETNCPPELMDDIDSFMIERDKYTPCNSDYLIRSHQGFFLPYSRALSRDIFKQWRLYSSCKMNSLLIKRYRHRKLRMSNPVGRFQELTGFPRNYCYEYYPKKPQA
jgi:integrase